jgi:zinc/manganese transport system permease protein
LTAILVLAFPRTDAAAGQPEGRLGTAYVVAAALSILILSKNRYAELGWLDLLKGEVITISNCRSFTLTAIMLALVLVALALFHKELFLVSFDRDNGGYVAQKRQHSGISCSTSCSGSPCPWRCLSVGPLIAFGFLLIPALTAHLFARTMRQFLLLASLIGGSLSLVGFWIAYAWDFPVGPADVVLLGVVYGLAWVIARIAGLTPEKRRSRKPPIMT